jgi:hypothetical protein
MRSDKMMGHLLEQFIRRAGYPYTQLAVNLPRVSRNDLRAQVHGQFGSYLRFAGGRRAEHCNDLCGTANHATKVRQPGGMCYGEQVN